MASDDESDNTNISDAPTQGVPSGTQIIGTYEITDLIASDDRLGWAGEEEAEAAESPKAEPVPETVPEKEEGTSDSVSEVETGSESDSDSKADTEEE